MSGLPRKFLKFLPELDMTINSFQHFFQIHPKFLYDFSWGSGIAGFGDVRADRSRGGEAPKICCLDQTNAPDGLVTILFDGF